jgi:DNA-binding NtrC family response regulator
MGAGIRVLLIDDSDIALDFQKMLLERHGFEVRTCGGLSELQPNEEAWRPQIVVTDVDLPDACDVDVVVALTNHPWTRGAPLVLCSGQPLADLERLREEKSLSGCVSKSENIRDLPDLLCRLAQASANDGQDGNSTTRQ